MDVAGSENVSGSSVNRILPCGEPSVDSVELVRDQLVAMLSSEQVYRVSVIPCSATDRSEAVPLDQWRRKICQWAFRVIDHFRLDRDVVTAGMNIFDRFLVAHVADDKAHTFACACPSCKRQVNSHTYQLAAMTSIFMAVKIHAENGSDNNTRVHRRQFKLSTFVELSRGQFDESDIYQMEQKVLKTLEWRVNPPTPTFFVAYLLNLMPDRSSVAEDGRSLYEVVIHVVRELSRYITELSTCLGESCSYHASSSVAFAAILTAMDLLTQEALPQSLRDGFRRQVFEVCGIGSHHSFGPIANLQSILQGALWPEMLLDDANHQPSETGHPISVARHYGLLDLHRIMETSSPANVTPPPSPGRLQRCPRRVSLEGSPISVAR